MTQTQVTSGSAPASCARKGFCPRPIAVGVVSALVVLALQLYVVAHYEWRPSALMLIADRQIKADPADETPYFSRTDFPAGTVVYQDCDGYDGSLYFLVAQDPLRLRAGFATDFKRRQLFRYQRLVAPLLAWALSMGAAARIPAAFAFINLAAVFIVGAAVAALLARDGRNGWWALAASLSPGLVFSAVYPMTEPVCVAFVALALLAHRKGQHGRAAVMLALAILTRETAVLYLGAIGLVELLSGRFRRTAAYALAAVPFLAWQGYLYLDAGIAPMGQSGFALTWPFGGMLAMRTFFEGAAGMRLIAQCATAAFAAWLVFLTLAALPAALKRREPMGVLLAVRSGFNIFAYGDFFSTFVNVTRTNAGVAMLAALFCARRRWVRWIAVAGAIAFSAAMVLRVVVNAAAPFALL